MPHFLSSAQAAPIVHSPEDLHFIGVALLHALGMGAVLMAVTGWVDQKQLKGSSPQANLQNSSNVLFMSVAIATVIILVGNNIARAFALGAAIALIRFKMKLGESSSGSGLLFAILCGMASAIGLHTVGWTLAIGYSIIQLALSRVISKMEPVVASDPASVQNVASENALAAGSRPPIFQPQLIRPVLPREVSKGQALLMALFVFVGAGALTDASAAECVGRAGADELHVTAAETSHVKLVSLRDGGQPLPLADCSLAPAIAWPRGLDVKENYKIQCTKYQPAGKAVAYAAREWEKSLAGTRFELFRRRFLGADLPVEVLLTETVQGNLALHVTFRLPDRDVAGIADLNPNPEGRWNLEWILRTSQDREWAVSCAVERVR